MTDLRPPLTAPRASAKAALCALGLAVSSLCVHTIARTSPDVRCLLVRSVDQANQPVMGLQPEDFIVMNAEVRYDVVAVTAASYPVALIVDTSTYAREDFQTARASVERFVDRLAPRPLAMYTSGTPISRVEDFTSDRKRILRAVGSTFATPDSGTHPLDTVLRAARDIGRSHPPISAAVVVSAGGIDISPPEGQQVLSALRGSHMILHVIERRVFDLRRGSRRDNSAAFQALAAKTHGQYVGGPSTSVYASGFEAVQRQLEAEVLVTYEGPAGASPAVTLRVRPPATVAMSVPVECGR